jgi:sugar (glycoside-pentoside-hexuronide) transporter
MAQSKAEYLTGGKERISYGVYFTGQLIFYGLVWNFLLPYFTDIGIPAFTVAGITLAVKVWDAVNDPIFGGIVDKVHFKKGKFLPWIKVSVIAIALTTIFLFGVPLNVSLSFKIIWVTVGYIFWDMAYTLCDVPCFGLVTTMTNKVGERNYLLAITRIFSGIGLLIAIMVLPVIRTKIGGWLPTAIVFSLAGAVFMLPVLLTAKERYVVPVSEKEFGIKEIFIYLSKNKYLLVFYLGTIIYGTGNISLTMYIARHNLGQESMMAIISLMGFAPGLLLSFFAPLLVRKFDKFKMFFWSVVAASIFGILAYFVGYKNFTAFLVMAFIRGISSGSILMFVNMFTPDMIEYGRYKTGITASGISFAAQTFTSKLHSAFATALAALCLSLIGFVEGEGAIQPSGFADKLWFVSCIIPAVMSLLAIPVYAQYKLRDKYAVVMAQYNNGEISRAEAEKALEGKIR